ncbi:AraC-like DNA-binding protein/mannose-6-phosphate isomerase-like protein (cupin superfamily) [Pseudomonas marginalis]|uniref:AraC family transcriptional regulator n=1 Tax=Pseudomonas TaxID=286 RepID=UPI0020A15B80|nr:MULTISPECIES: helix-turn-helix transcriptional regulator [Pseudomonas]MCP1506963.1 AraC-like DNA-binding protein/mannose-6-phosphate isomerase-like protein (cupin superfamily) [Pseudomonas marginalis]MCP1524467.1 AraC-like DNA-binding protein/mannose-6-phosphate isomerase-like protein (cupin superfamily) [Pseudomonas marginalis]
MPVSRNSGSKHRKKGEAIKTLDKFLRDIDEGEWAVISSATDYADNWVIPEHSHEKHQLLYATEGVMVVHSAQNQWTVPPNRGFWMPCGHVHSLRCVGALKMRSVFVRPASFPNLPSETKAVSISPLLSELIKASVSLKPPYAEDSRDARIMHLILDELALLPALPLSLPQPADPRIRRICLALQDDPGDASTVADWSERLGLDQTTIQRLFRRETGLTFGQWRQQARLLLALERIAVGEKIIDVAFELGYESPSAFTSMFKKQFGKTPSQFFR